MKKMNKKRTVEAYRDWIKNFSNLSDFARCYKISEEKAEKIINHGRTLHDDSIKRVFVVEITEVFGSYEASQVILTVNDDMNAIGEGWRDGEFDEFLEGWTFGGNLTRIPVVINKITVKEANAYLLAEGANPKF